MSTPLRQSCGANITSTVIGSKTQATVSTWHLSLGPLSARSSRPRQDGTLKFPSCHERPLPVAAVPCPPGSRDLARPATESPGKGARLRIVEGCSDLAERHLCVLQQLTRNLEPDLVRDIPVSHAAVLQVAAQGAAVHGQQMGDVISRTAGARQPYAQQPADVVREFPALPALQLADPLLQHGPQHGISSGDATLQAAARKQQRGTLLIEPHWSQELPPIG